MPLLIALEPLPLNKPSHNLFSFQDRSSALERAMRGCFLESDEKDIPKIAEIVICVVIKRSQGSYPYQIGG